MVCPFNTQKLSLYSCVFKISIELYKKICRFDCRSIGRMYYVWTNASERLLLQKDGTAYVNYVIEEERKNEESSSTLPL